MMSAEFQEENHNTLEDARADAQQVYDATAYEHLASIDRCRLLGQKFIELRDGDRNLLGQMSTIIVSGRLKLEYIRAKRAGKRMREADDYRNAVLQAMQPPNAQ